MIKSVDITGLDKAELLAALYNGSRQFGAGFLHAAGANDITIEHAKEIIKGKPSTGLLPWELEDAKHFRFDYVHGRVLKVYIGGDSFCPSLYDRDMGEGAAARVVERLRDSLRSRDRCVGEVA
jgi:hypothetical protein